VTFCFQSWNLVRVHVKGPDVADELPAAARPGAPALEKGLDVLELLAGTAHGLTQKQIAEGVGRSVGEIFRMLTVLEQRGFVTRDRPGGEYTLTLRLFHLATQHPPTRRLQQAATAVLEHLAERTGLSCHLSVASGAHFTVVAQTEPEWQMGWRVKLGARFPLSLRYPSARVLAAFQPDARRQELGSAIARFDALPLGAVLDDLAAVRQEGGLFASGKVAPAVTSLSCPILDANGHALAALTVPMMHDGAQLIDEAAIAAHLRAAAERIAVLVGVA
jgi:DNA-binding IclR family transcriptional regulator